MATPRNQRSFLSNLCFRGAIVAILELVSTSCESEDLDQQENSHGTSGATSSSLSSTNADSSTTPDVSNTSVTSSSEIDSTSSSTPSDQLGQRFVIPSKLELCAFLGDAYYAPLAFLDEFRLTIEPGEWRIDKNEPKQAGPSFQLVHGDQEFRANASTLLSTEVLEPVEELFGEGVRLVFEAGSELGKAELSLAMGKAANTGIGEDFQMLSPFPSESDPVFASVYLIGDRALPVFSVTPNERLGLHFGDCETLSGGDDIFSFVTLDGDAIEFNVWGMLDIGQAWVSHAYARATDARGIYKGQAIELRGSQSLSAAVKGQEERLRPPALALRLTTPIDDTCGLLFEPNGLAVPPDPRYKMFTLDSSNNKLDEYNLQSAVFPDRYAFD
jgi:hypothetical protein